MTISHMILYLIFDGHRKMDTKLFILKLDFSQNMYKGNVHALITIKVKGFSKLRMQSCLQLVR